MSQPCVAEKTLHSRLQASACYKLKTAPQPLQITTDGFGPYGPAIDAKLSDRVDYAMLIKAMLIKQYAENTTDEKRHSP